jgi:excisionase family DNA binding protein
MVTKERPYYSIAEAARVLNVSRSTVWRWIAAGWLKAHRLGPKTIRIADAELQSLIQPARPQGHRILTNIKDMKQALATPPTADELAQHRALFERIKEHRKHLVISPLTTADLIHMAREVGYESYGFDR